MEEGNIQKSYLNTKYRILILASCFVVRKARWFGSLFPVCGDFKSIEKIYEIIEGNVNTLRGNVEENLHDDALKKQV